MLPFSPCSERPSELTIPVVSVPSRAEGIADGQHLLADLQIVRIAQVQKGQLAVGIDLDQREVVARVDPLIVALYFLWSDSVTLNSRDPLTT